MASKAKQYGHAMPCHAPWSDVSTEEMRICQKRVRLNHGTYMQGRTVAVVVVANQVARPMGSAAGLGYNWQWMDGSWMTTIPKVEAAAAQFPQTLCLTLPDLIRFPKSIPYLPGLNMVLEPREEENHLGGRREQLRSVIHSDGA